jgi:ATP-dependent protease HslVU (ClpYQ) peptidase subunit
MSRPEAARYRTTNWRSDDALRRRGSLLIWLDKDMAWLATKAGVLAVGWCSLMRPVSSA